jgi:hypothetical protein
MSVALAEIGHNNPPVEIDPYEAMKVHIDDLLLEAHNWADGTEVETDAQVEEAGRLIGELEAAARDAEAKRVEEKKPHDEVIAAIQAKWNVYIADRKNKAPGKVWKAVDALKATVKPYLDAKELKRKADLAEAQAAAQKAQEEAIAAAQAARASDLGAQEDVEELVAVAQQLAVDAKRAETSRVQLVGGDRAKGLRTTYTAVIDNPKDCLIHYWTTRRDDLIAVLQGYADADVRAKRHTIPGVSVIEGTTL